MMKDTSYLTQTHNQYNRKRTPVRHRVHWMAHGHGDPSLIIRLLSGTATRQDITPVKDDPSITRSGTRWGVTDRYNDISIYKVGDQKLEGFELPFYLLRIMQKTATDTFYIDLSSQQQDDIDLYLGRIVIPPFGQDPIMLDMARWTNKKIQNSIHLRSFKINPLAGFTYVQTP